MMMMIMMMMMMMMMFMWQEGIVSVVIVRRSVLGLSASCFVQSPLGSWTDEICLVVSSPARVAGRLPAAGRQQVTTDV